MGCGCDEEERPPWQAPRYISSSIPTTQRYSQREYCNKDDNDCSCLWDKFIVCILTFIILIAICMFIGIEPLYSAIIALILALCLGGCLKAVLEKIGLIA